MNISIQPIIIIMNDLTDAHKQLLNLCEQKLSNIKNNNMEELSKVLNIERKYIQKIDQLETKRQKVIEEFISRHNIPVVEKTASQLLQHLKNSNERVILEKQIVKLIEVIVQLRAIEQLNEELLQQSMEFVQTSLDLFDLTIKNYNYNNHLSEQSSQSSKNRSIFDSKA